MIKMRQDIEEMTNRLAVFFYETQLTEIAS
jgi:hypothetical protein